MQTLTDIEKIVLLANIVVDTVREAGAEGAPAGVLYAALMTIGISHASFQALMDMLVTGGRLRRSGHLYFVTGGAL